MPRSLASLAWTFLRSPSRAAHEAPKARLDGACVLMYGAATIAFMLVFWLKPFDFPDPAAAAPLEAQDLSQWLKAEMWQPVLEAGWIAFLLGLIRFYSTGSWPVRLSASLLWTAAPYLLIASYAQVHAFPKWAFAVGCAAWLGSYYPFLRALRPTDLWPLVNFCLAVNVIGLPIAAVLGAAVALGQRELFTGGQIIGGLWLLGATTLGVRELSGLRLPRAFMAVLFSAFMQFALAFCLHFLGAKGVLKALYYG